MGKKLVVTFYEYLGRQPIEFIDDTELGPDFRIREEFVYFYLNDAFAAMYAKCDVQSIVLVDAIVESKSG